MQTQWPTKRVLCTLIKNKAANYIRLNFGITPLFLFHLVRLNKESVGKGQAKQLFEDLINGLGLIAALEAAKVKPEGRQHHCGEESNCQFFRLCDFILSVLQGMSCQVVSTSQLLFCV